MHQISVCAHEIVSVIPTNKKMSPNFCTLLKGNLIISVAAVFN